MYALVHALACVQVVLCAADNVSPLWSNGALIQMCSMMCWYHVVRLKLAAVGSWLPDAVTSEDRSNCMSYVGNCMCLNFRGPEHHLQIV